MSHFSTAYYHGSTVPCIRKLKIDWDINSPFGPAIYLTREPIVADCYYRPGGAIYVVALCGNPNFTLNLDASFQSQTVEAREAVLKSIKELGFSVAVKENSRIRDLIHPVSSDRPLVNRTLAKHGIWMIYGHLSAYEYSGLQDRGIQYAVIEEASANILIETMYDEIVAREKVLARSVAA